MVHLYLDASLRQNWSRQAVSSEAACDTRVKKYLPMKVIFHLGWLMSMIKRGGNTLKYVLLVFSNCLFHNVQQFSWVDACSNHNWIVFSTHRMPFHLSFQGRHCIFPFPQLLIMKGIVWIVRRSDFGTILCSLISSICRPTIVLGGLILHNIMHFFWMTKVGIVQWNELKIILLVFYLWYLFSSANETCNVMGLRSHWWHFFFPPLFIGVQTFWMEENFAFI